MPVAKHRGGFPSSRRMEPIPINQRMPARCFPVVVSISRTFSIPIRFSSAATNSAALRTSPRAPAASKPKVSAAVPSTPLQTALDSPAQIQPPPQFLRHHSSLPKKNLRAVQPKTTGRITSISPHFRHPRYPLSPVASKPREGVNFLPKPKRSDPMTTSMQDGTMVDKIAQFDLPKELAEAEQKKPWPAGDPFHNSLQKTRSPHRPHLDAKHRPHERAPRRRHTLHSGHQRQHPRLRINWQGSRSLHRHSFHPRPLHPPRRRSQIPTPPFFSPSPGPAPKNSRP